MRWIGGGGGDKLGHAAWFFVYSGLGHLVAEWTVDEIRLVAELMELSHVGY